MAEYWNAELETRPWAEVERWQAAQVTAMLAPLRRRSRLYARLHAGVADDLVLRSAADLAALPFTLKDALRIAQLAAGEAEPLGDNQAVPRDDLEQRAVFGRALGIALALIPQCAAECVGE